MQDKEQQIIDAAIQLFAQDGLAVPTAKIAKVAQVANGTLFNYFATKQMLIDAVYVGIKRELASAFLGAGVVAAPTAREGFKIFWCNYMHWALATPLKHRVMNLLMGGGVVSPEAHASVSLLFKPLCDEVDAAMRDGIVRQMPDDYLYRIKSAQIEAAVTYALEKQLQGEALEAHINTSFEIYWNGIKA